MTWEAGKCPNCGEYDSLEPLPKELKDVTFYDHGGRVFQVHQYLCLSCASSDMIRRSFHKVHEKDEPAAPWMLAPGDGRIFVARPLTEEE